MNCLENIGKVIQIKPSVVSCLWEITNFDTLDLFSGAFVLSPLIATDHPDIKWRMALFPNGRGVRVEASRSTLSLFIQLFSSNDAITETTASVKFGLLDAANKFVSKHRLAEGKYKVSQESELRNWTLPRAAGRENFIARSFIMDESNNVLQDNTLRLSCEILSYDPIFTVPLQQQTHRDKSRLHEFSDFKKLLDSEKFSDVEFIIGDRKLRAHKAILVSRSPVFRAMFNIDMQENQQNIVHIVDIKYEVMNELLHFIYSGTIDSIEKIACDLLMASEKYCISGLKALCEQALCGDLNVDNALERLTVAYLCNSVSLKTQAIDFVVNNANEMVEREEFISLRPELMYEITRGITRKRTNH